MRITITNEQNFLSVDEKKIKRVLQSIPEAPKKFRLSVVYLDDAEMTRLNQRYLKKDESTDVLAFPMGNEEGEVIVSAEMAKKEAEARGIEPDGELLLYTLHGFLHLIGYDDKTPEQAEEMHNVEKEILIREGYTWSWD